MTQGKWLKLGMLILLISIMVTGYGGLCDKKSDSGSSTPPGSSSLWVLANTGIGAGEGLSKLSTPSASVVWISGNTGVYRSTNGATFTKVLNDTDQDQPLALDANTAWAMANFSIQKTTNGGTSWTTQTIDSWPDKNGISAVDANTLYSVGWEGAIWKTTNGGTSWTKIRTETMNEQFGSVVAVSVSVVYATGTQGLSSVTGDQTIYKTSDGGSTWSRVYLGASGSGWLSNIVAADANNVWAVGQSGKIVRTTNGGTSWTVLSSGTTTDLNGIARRSSDGLLVAVGGSGTIISSLDNGATWTAENSGTTQGLGRVSFGGNTAWIVGANSTILKK